MTMTLACGTCFRLCDSIVALTAVVVFPSDSRARSTFPVKSVEHEAYEGAVPRETVAVVSSAIVNVEQY